MGGEDGCSPGRPRTDPRSHVDRSGPGGGGPRGVPQHTPDATVAAPHRARRGGRPGDPRGAAAGPHRAGGAGARGPPGRPAPAGASACRGRGSCAVVGALGPLPGGSRVTVEPGGQVELSAPPRPASPPRVAALRARQRRPARRRSPPSGCGWALLGADPARPAAGSTRPAGTPRWSSTSPPSAAPDAGLAMMSRDRRPAGQPRRRPRGGLGGRGSASRTGWARCWSPSRPARRCSPGTSTGWRSARQRVWGDLDQARCGPLLGGRDPAARVGARTRCRRR